MEGSCKMYVGKTNWMEHKLKGVTPIRAAFVFAKACDIVGEDAFSVASLHSSILFLGSAGTAW